VTDPVPLTTIETDPTKLEKPLRPIRGVPIPIEVVNPVPLGPPLPEPTIAPINVPSLNTFIGPSPKTSAPTVDLPNWNDIVHITPYQLLTPDEKRARSRQLIKAIKDSPIPEWRQNYGRVLTDLDNIEDALTTTILLGRVAARVAPRIIPGLNILAGIDLVLSAVITLGRLPAPRSVRKLRLTTWAARNPKKVLSLFKGNVGALQALPHWSQLLEVAQTTDWLFGTGLQLGPIFGTIESTVFAGVQAGIAGALDGFATPGQREAWRALESAAGLAAPNSNLPTNTKLTIAAGVTAAADLALDNLTEPVRINLNPYAQQLATTPIPARKQTDPITAEELQRAGWDFDAPARWTLPGLPTEITSADHGAHLQQQARDWAGELITDIGNSQLGELAGQLITLGALGLTDLARGDAERPTFQTDPESRVLGELLERGIQLETSDVPEPAHTLIRQLATQTDASGRLNLTTAEIVRQADALAVTLTRDTGALLTTPPPEPEAPESQAEGR
jgi:hypothetical protein